MKSLLARECSKLLSQCNSISEVTVSSLFEQNFLCQAEDSKKYGGLIAVRVDSSSKELHFVWAHTTQSMGVAYFSNTLREPEVTVYIAYTHLPRPSCLS